MSAYCTQADLEAYYGRHNVHQWASLNSNATPTEIAARITLAIEQASAVVNGELNAGPYTVPFQDAPNSPAMIKRACIYIAGHDLYAAKGYEDTSPEGQGINRLSGDLERANDILARIRGGIMRLEVAPVGDLRSPEVLRVPASSDEACDPRCACDEFKNWD